MMIYQFSTVNKNIKPYSAMAYKSNNITPLDNSQNQSGLSFAQSNVLKNTRLLNNINFKGKVLAPSFDVKDIKIIQNLLSKCRYGKKDLIYGDISHIKLHKTDSGIAIENFYTHDNNTNGEITGICEELTYKLGKRLEKLFGDKYIFFAIDGSNKEFPDAHTHLAIFKNTHDNKLKIDNITHKQTEYLKRLTEINHEINQINQGFANSQIYQDYHSKMLDMINTNPSVNLFSELNNTILGKQFIEKRNEINTKINLLKKAFNCDELKNCLMIDPSFKRVEEFGTGTLFDKYNCNTIRRLDEINAVPSNSRLVPNLQGIPLGYLKDLIPEKANRKNGNLMGVLNNIYGKINLRFETDTNIVGELDTNHSFAKFVDKLNQSIIE